MLHEFEARYAGQRFPYCEELFDGLRTGAVQLASSPRSDSSLTCGHYARVYRVRMQSARERSGPYWAESADAMERLCTELEQTRDEPCELWALHSHEREYVVFGIPARQVIAGCLRLKIQRGQPR